MRREENDRDVMLESFGALYADGYPVDWTRLYPSGGRVVPLPAYAWQHERFWVDNNGHGPQPDYAMGGHPLHRQAVARDRCRRPGVEPRYQAWAGGGYANTPVIKRRTQLVGLSKLYNSPNTSSVTLRCVFVN